MNAAVCSSCVGILVIGHWEAGGRGGLSDFGIVWKEGPACFTKNSQ